MLIDSILKEKRNSITDRGLKYSVLQHYIQEEDTLNELFSVIVTDEQGNLYNDGQYSIYSEEVAPIVLNDGSRYILRYRGPKKQEDMNILQSLILSKLNLISPQFLPIDMNGHVVAMLEKDMSKGNITDPDVVEFLKYFPAVILAGDDHIDKTFNYYNKTLVECFSENPLLFLELCQKNIEKDIEKHNKKLQDFFDFVFNNEQARTTMADIFCKSPDLFFKLFEPETYSSTLSNDLEQIYLSDGQIPHGPFVKGREFLAEDFTINAGVNLTKTRLVRMSTFDTKDYLTSTAYYVADSGLIEDIVPINGSFNAFTAKKDLKDFRYRTEFSKGACKLEKAIYNIRNNKLLNNIMDKRERADFANELNNVDAKDIATEYEDKTKYKINRRYLEAVQQNKELIAEEFSK